jgi:membrane fusion protein, macrolide-specific efflux system
MIWYQNMWMRIPFPRALKKNIDLAVILVVSLFLAWNGWVPGAVAQQPAAPSQSAAGDILLSGKLACSLKRAVVMPFLGVITALPVQAGQRVTSGTILARYLLLPESVAQIRSRLFPTQIKDLEMTQAKLAAQLNELDKQFAGLQQLALKSLTSQQSLDQVEKEISLTCKEKTAVAERLGWARQIRQDDLVLLQKQLGISPGIKNIPAEGRLSSPLDGNVVWVHPDMRVGAELKPTELVFFIGKLDPMVIKAQVHELEAVRLQLGDPAEVQVVSLPGKKFPARVSRISWSSLNVAADQPSFFEVEFTVPNPEHILKDGLKVSLVVHKDPVS